MGTPRKAAESQEVFPGRYLHIGLSNEVTELLEEYSTEQIPNTIQVDLSNDGERLNKESCVWPIMCRIFNLKKTKIGIVGI